MFKAPYCLLIFIFLCGCQSTVNYRYPQTSLSQSEIQEAELNIIDCAEQLKNKEAKCPEAAKGEYKLEDFKYGRFCGKNYPVMPNMETNEYKLLTKETRLSLARELIKIRPIDDIDQACKAHDICWTINGNSRLECNDELRDKLDKLYAEFKHQIGSSDTETRQWRCAQLARDISYSTVLYEAQSDDKVNELGMYLVKGVTVPLHIFYFLLYEISAVFKQHPLPHERCWVAK